MSTMYKPDGFSATVEIEAARIDRHPACDVRVNRDKERIEVYAENLDDLPPVDVIADSDDKHWLADGIHRFEAYLSKGRKSIPCRVRRGDYVDAYFHACHANDAHGIPTTNADKRRRVEVALKRFPDRSNRVIAEICGVNTSTVLRIKPEIQVVHSTTSPPTVTGRDGKQYPAKKTNKKTAPKAPKPKAAPPPPEPVDRPEPEPEPEDDGHAGAKAAINEAFPSAPAPNGETSSSPGYDPRREFDAVEDYLDGEVERCPERHRKDLAWRVFIHSKVILDRCGLAFEEVEYGK